MKKHKFKTIGSNAVDPASPRRYKGVPGKGGKTTNSIIYNKEGKKNA